MYVHCQFVLPSDSVFAYLPTLTLISNLKMNVCGAFVVTCRREE